MFNLDQAISRWRRQMQAEGIKTPVPLNELENHLRDDIEQEMQKGADVETAFSDAVERIGTAVKLRHEFGKIEATKKARNRELLRRWSVVAGTGFVYITLFGTWWMGAQQGKMEITPLEITLAVSASVPMILFGWAGRSFAKVLPVIDERWIIAITFGMLLLGSALFRIFFPFISPTNLVHLQIVFLWVLSPILGFGNCVSAWHDRCATARSQVRIANA